MSTVIPAEGNSKSGHIQLAVAPHPDGYDLAAHERAEVDESNMSESQKKTYHEEVDNADTAHMTNAQKKELHEHALQHAKDHKHKYGIGCCLITLAIVIGVLFGVVLVVAAVTGASVSDTFEPTASEIISGKLASTVTTATLIPSKSSSSRRRRHRELFTPEAMAAQMQKKQQTKAGIPDLFMKLDALTNLFGDKIGESQLLRGTVDHPSLQRAASSKKKTKKNAVRNLALSEDPTVPSDLSDFEDEADYMLSTDPVQVVYDEAADTINMVNTIGCAVSQIKLFEVGLNTSCNPGRKSFTTLIDDSLCDSQADTFSEWYVHTVSGPNGGDGTYDFGIEIVWMGQMTVFSTLSSVIKDGVKAREILNFLVPNEDPNNEIKGFMEQTYDAASGDATVTYEEADSDDNVYLWVHAEYNKETSIGAAISGDDDENTHYELNIGADNYLKKKTEGSNTPVETCVDFTEEAQKLVDNTYSLFSAMDGSKLPFQAGFPIELIHDDFARPLMAFISYWGLHVAPYFDTTDGSITGSDEVAGYFTNGATVVKTVDTSNTEYNLNLVEARLMKVTRKEMTLGEVTLLPMTISNGGYSDTKVRWNGTHFETIGVRRYECYQNSDDDYPSVITTSFTPESWEDCQCVDTDGSRKSSGAYTDGAFAYMADKVAVGGVGDLVTFTSDEYPRGVDIQVGGIWGRITLEYEVQQVLHLSGKHSFSAGDTVTQSSSGATGTVAYDSYERLFGLECSPGNCYTMIGNDYESCAATNPSDASDAGFAFYAGLVLTQANTGATATVAVDSYIWEGIAITDVTGTFTFDDANSITVSMPSGGLPGNHDWVKSVTSNNAYTFASGSGLSDDWPSAQFPVQPNCTASGIITVTTTIDSASGTADIDVYIDHEENRAYGWISRAGAGCDASSDGVLTIPSSDVSAAVDAHSGITCTTLPEIIVRCARRIEAASSRLVVNLPSSSATLFTKSDSPWLNDAEVIVTPSGGSGATVGSPYWIWKESGAVKPITDSTMIQYQLRDVVNPDDTVNELACYGDCPEIQSGMSGSIPTYDQPSVVGEVSIDSGGDSCTVSDGQSVPIISTAAFSDAGDLLGVNDLVFEWVEEERDGSTVWYLDAVELASGSSGAGCTSDASVTLTTADCSSPPELSLSCWEGQDAALAAGSTDVSNQQAKLYSFDESTGYLTDKAHNYAQDIIPDDSHYFGIFFDNTAENYNALKCDWDDTKLCHWKGYESLSTYYRYETGGNYAKRVTLTNSEGDVVSVDKPTILTYTHEGTSSNSGRNYDNAIFLLEYMGANEGLHGLPTYCIDSSGAEAACDPWNPFSLQDINIPADGVLTGVEGDIAGHKFYSKPSSVYEYYPTTANSDCTSASLSFGTDPILDLPAFDEMFVKPPQFESPDTATLESDYALGGAPLSIGGTPLFELEGTDGECVASL
jgi:hypothetical protein